MIQDAIARNRCEILLIEIHILREQQRQTEMLLGNSKGIFVLHHIALHSIQLYFIAFQIE